MTLVYVSPSIQVMDNVDESGASVRKLLLAPFTGVQGAILKDNPTFHVHQYSRNLTYAAASIAPGTLQRALILGMGAGIVVQAVRELHPQAEIDIVDLAEEIFHVAHTFFFPIDANNIHLHHADAAAFVANTPHTYDFICCDIWGGNLAAPPILLTEGFYDVIRRLLRQDGVFAINTQNTLHKSASEMLADRFPRLQSLRGNNTLLIASLRQKDIALADALIAHLRSWNIDVHEIERNALTISNG